MTELAQAVREAVGDADVDKLWRPDKETEEKYWRLFGGAKKRSEYGDHRYHSWDCGLARMALQSMKRGNTKDKHKYTLEELIAEAEPELKKAVKYKEITPRQAQARLEALKIWYEECEA